MLNNTKHKNTITKKKIMCKANQGWTNKVVLFVLLEETEVGT
jgi:hypothetical protein